MEGKVWKIKIEREKKKLICCVKNWKRKKMKKWKIIGRFLRFSMKLKEKLKDKKLKEKGVTPKKFEREKIKNIKY